MNNLLEFNKSEEAVMEAFWRANRPLTSMDLINMIESYNDSYIHKILRALAKKNVIEVCGIINCGKQYARQFIPTITKEEYAAQVMNSLGIKNESALAKVAVAMARESGTKKGNSDNNGNGNLIKELESILEELKKQ